MSTGRWRDDNDWQLRAEPWLGEITTANWNYVPVAGPSRFLLDITLTVDEAYRLLNDQARLSHGHPEIVDYGYGLDRAVRARNIEITAAEAGRIGRGEHPRDVLFWPECGWRLTVRPDPLVTGHW